jgi:predicted regulator of Ras-like GTPase activity (Roadblock/LC7/MglB family)
MPSIRDVVQALGRREGVDAVIVLGRDGLTVDAHTRDGLDADGLSALIPSVAAACTRLGTAGARGEFAIGVAEYARGIIIIAVLTPEVMLAVLVQPNINVGVMLYELKLHRTAIAGLL